MTMVMSRKAAQKLKERLVWQCFGAGLGFRIVGSGVSGGDAVNIKLDKKRSDDETMECEGVRLLLDHESARIFRGCELDYTEDPEACFLIRSTTH